MPVAGSLPTLRSVKQAQPKWASISAPGPASLSPAGLCSLCWPGQGLMVARSESCPGRVADAPGVRWGTWTQLLVESLLGAVALGAAVGGQAGAVQLGQPSVSLASVSTQMSMLESTSALGCAGQGTSPAVQAQSHSNVPALLLPSLRDFWHFCSSLCGQWPRAISSHRILAPLNVKTGKNTETWFFDSAPGFYLLFP